MPLRWFRYCCLLLSFLTIPLPIYGAASDESKRLILIKVDGLAGVFLDAALEPEAAYADELPHPDDFRQAYQELSGLLGREILLPNLHYYFSVDGSRAETIYSGTLPLSAAAWAMIDTGQASIVKNHFYFNRATGELYGYLDGLRESLNQLMKGSRKTTAVWQLDLLGIPLLEDFFPNERTWTSIQLLYRQRPVDQLSNLGKFLVRGGRRDFNPFGILKQQFSHFVYHPDYPEWNDEALSRLAASKILENDERGAELFDFVSVILPTLDHQFHVDPDYRRTLAWLVRLDDWVGEIFRAVEESRSRERTVVSLVSDHGLDFDPRAINHTFPINRWLRKEDFGSHTVLSPHTENYVHAVSVPVRGVDSSKIYESPTSPFGASVPHGSKGYYTAFTANAGNPRFDAFLRNSDLNALHLLLLEILRLQGSVDRLEKAFPLYKHVLENLYTWLPEEINRLQLAIDFLPRRLDSLPHEGKEYREDAASRLRKETESYRAILPALRRLLRLPKEKGQWLEWSDSSFQISDYIPAGYLGPPNNLGQLKNYIVGWERRPEERWKVDSDCFRRIDYPETLAEFQVTNPNAYGNPHPFNFFSASIPTEYVVGPWARDLQQIVWLKASRGRGEALILESLNGEIAYLPIEDLVWEEKGFQVEHTSERDPLGYLEIVDSLEWLTPREWARRSGPREFSVTPVILMDLFRENFERVLDDPGFLEEVPLAERNQIVEALRVRFDQGVPDFRVWMNRGWNVNSKSHTPGGTHGGFNPIETRTSFLIWGGRDLPLNRGQKVQGPYFTYDIVPTLLEAVGIKPSSPNPLPGTVVPFLSETVE